MRLMIAFAFERSGLGVTSGISATAGDRYVFIAISSSTSTVMNAARRPGTSIFGRISIRMTAASVPPTMNGMRLPKRVLYLSESRPNSGSMNSASTLSSAII